MLDDTRPTVRAPAPEPSAAFLRSKLVRLERAIESIRSEERAILALLENRTERKEDHKRA